MRPALPRARCSVLAARCAAQDRPQTGEAQPTRTGERGHGCSPRGGPGVAAASSWSSTLYAGRSGRAVQRCRRRGPRGRLWRAGHPDPGRTRPRGAWRKPDGYATGTAGRAAGRGYGHRRRGLRPGRAVPGAGSRRATTAGTAQAVHDLHGALPRGRAAGVACAWFPRAGDDRRQGQGRGDGIRLRPRQASPGQARRYPGCSRSVPRPG